MDEHHACDPIARFDVKAFATQEKKIIGVEGTSNAGADCGESVSESINRIGYTMRDFADEPDGALNLEACLHRQSPDIASAVNREQKLGADDQGIILGYVTDETQEYMTLPKVLVQNLSQGW